MDHSSTLRDLFQQAEGANVPPASVQEDPVPDEGAPSADDKNRLEELFGPPRKDPGPTGGTHLRTHRESPRESSWPEHNYNEAYHQITRHRPRPRRNRDADDTTLWEIHELLDEDKGPLRTGPPSPAPAAPSPWPDHKGLDLAHMDDPLSSSPLDVPAPRPHDASRSRPHDPGQWLDALAEGPPLATTTEARLIGTLRGEADMIRRPLFDTTETLHTTDPAQSGAGATEPAPAKKQARLARPRALFLKIAGVALGLKIGISVGYLLATLL